jgi:hypothetical protein
MLHLHYVFFQVVRYEDMMDKKLRIDLLEKIGTFISRDHDNSCLGAPAGTSSRFHANFYNQSDVLSRRHRLECAFHIADTRRTHRASTDSEAQNPRNRKVDSKLAFDQDSQLVEQMWAQFKEYAEYFRYTMNTRHH